MSDKAETGGLDLGGGGEEEPKDPFATVPAEVGEDGEQDGATLGGEGATLEDLQAEQEEPAAAGEEDLAADPPPLPSSEEPEPEPEPAAAEPEPAPAATEEPAEEPTPPTKKEGTAERPYTVLYKAEDGNWAEATDKPIKAANGEVALREAYASLVPADSEDSYTLVVIPVHYWKPKEVKAKKKISRAVEIN
jgi:hypothetical protein